MRWIDIAEAANPNPSKFWLVLRLGEDDPDTAPQLAEGSLKGLKGISASREIVGDFLHTSGNACLVMNPNEVLNNNDVSMVDYKNVDSLVANNMRVITRLYNQNNDIKGISRTLQNILRNTVRYLKENNHPDASTMIYYGSADNISYLYGDNPTPLNTVSDIAQFVEWGLMEHAKEKRISPFEISKKDLMIGIEYALLKDAELYESESEWLVDGDVFNVPPGSILLIIKSGFAEEHYDAWKAGEFNAEWNPNRWRLRAFDTIMNQIEEYSLDKKYKIRFISEEKFAQIIPKTKSRRRKRKYNELT